jgi:UDP-N-acetylglucosamine 1-carboxyvinyltransferase
MGVNIIVDNRTFIIKGKRKLNGAEFSVIPDRIEAGTYALLGASIGDNISISPVIKEHLESLFEIFDILEVPYEYSNHVLNISRCNINKGILIETKPYPGFPTDLQQPLTAFLTQLNATSVIIETIYENRFAHIPMLNKMGANIIKQNNMIVVVGGNQLKGAKIDGKDLRGGASLLIAALCAEGESILTGLKFINRGYENIVNKCQKLGAEIKS